MTTQRTLSVKLLPDVSAVEEAVKQVKQRASQQIRGGGSPLTSGNTPLTATGGGGGNRATNIVPPVGAGAAGGQLSSGLKGLGQQLAAGGGLRGGLTALTGGLTTAAAALGPLTLGIGAVTGALAGLGAAGLRASAELQTAAYRQHQAERRQLTQAWNSLASRWGDAIYEQLSPITNTLAQALNHINRRTGGRTRTAADEFDARRELDEELRREPETPVQPPPALPPLPGLQEGGIVKPRPGGTPVIVGEGGQPEAVVPLPQNTLFGGSSLPARSVSEEMELWWRLSAREDFQLLFDELCRCIRDSSIATRVRREIALTQAEYDALPEKDFDVLYVIVE